LETTADHDGTKYTRDEDMVLCVKGVIAAVGSKIPLATFNNIFMRLYLNSLNSKHQPPYHLERIRIVEIMANYVMLECSRILEECREAIGGALMSAVIDFWRCLHCKECFGALVVDLIANKYFIEEMGMSFFMSKETVQRLGDFVVCVSIINPLFLPYMLLHMPIHYCSSSIRTRVLLIILSVCSTLSLFSSQRHVPMFLIG
jgi:hypothetical protein